MSYQTPSGKHAGKCKKTLERRGKGKRYVYARWTCWNRVRAGEDYCWQHQPTNNCDMATVR